MPIYDMRTWQAPRTSFMEDTIQKQWEYFEQKLSKSWAKEINPLVDDYKDRVQEKLEMQFEVTMRKLFARHQADTRTWYSDSSLDATNEGAINMLSALLERFIIDIQSISRDLFQDSNSPRELEFHSGIGFNIQDHRGRMGKFTLDCTNLIRAITRLYENGVFQDNSFWVESIETNTFKWVSWAKWAKYTYVSKHNNTIELLSFAFYTLIPKNNIWSNAHLSDVFYELTRWYFDDIVNYIILDGKRRGSIDGRK